MSNVDNAHYVYLVIKDEDGKEIISRQLGVTDRNSYDQKLEFDFEAAYKLLNLIAGRDWHL